MTYYRMHSVIGMPHQTGQYLLRVVKKADASLRRTRPLSVPREHLERLAETSEHLLEDIGFKKDAAQSNADQTVWVLDHIEITAIHAE